MRLKRFMALGAMALAIECAAQPPPCSLEEMARLGGEFASVSSSGQIAIVSVANRLLVMDVSDPTDPVEVGRLEGLEGVRNHRMAGSIALVLVDDELRVIDLSNPASPIQIGAVTPIAGEKSWDRPAVDGSTVYLVYAYAGPATTIVSIDIADPAHPVVLDSIDGPESTIAYVSAGGGVVGCSLDRRGAGSLVWFIDASDPADLKSASVVGSSQRAEDLACNGSIACVFNSSVIDIYDTSNPYQPSIVGSASTFAWYTVEIELAGDTLFASIGYDFGGGVLHAFDVSNPAQPAALGTPIRSLNSAPRSISPSGEGALMLVDSALKAVQVHPKFAVVGTYASVGYVTDVALGRDRLIFASGSGVHIYDVSDPRSPTKIGTLAPPTSWATVRAQGDLGYFVRGNLDIFDISPATGPTLISSTYIPCLGLFEVDGTVGIGACYSDHSAVVIDLSDLMRPVVSPALTLPPYVAPEDVAIEGDIALVAADTLYVLDVSDPTSPRVVSSLLRRPRQVALANGIAYVSLLSGPGAIVDLRDPAKPIVIGSLPLRSAMDLAVSGDLLYASVHASPTGLWVFDVTDPNAVSVVGSFNATYQARAVAADDAGRVALVRGFYGLSLLEACRPCYPDCTQTTGLGVLDIWDFLCWQGWFARGDPYACDCDMTTGPGVCDIFDFLCFQNAFVAGCP